MEIAAAARGLRHVYPPQKRKVEPRVALGGVDLEVRRGEIFGLLGPNGGGKTTVFRILATSLVPTGGEASVFGMDVVRAAAAVRRRIGVVFQNPGLDRRLSVRENLVHQGRLYGLGGAGLSERVADMLARVGLSDRASDAVEGLSGGLRRRAELAKGLLHRPELLILDEPSTGLDPGARAELWSYLKELKAKDGITVLVTTHLMEEAEKCDRLAIIDKGLIVALGTPDSLKDAIGGEVVSIRSPEPDGLRAAVQAMFGGEPTVVEDTVRIERAEAHSLVPAIMEAFPERILSLTVGKPTLEDVFIRRTKHRFWWSPPEGPS